LEYFSLFFILPCGFLVFEKKMLVTSTDKKEFALCTKTIKRIPLFQEACFGTFSMATENSKEEKEKENISFPFHSETLQVILKFLESCPEKDDGIITPIQSMTDLLDFTSQGTKSHFTFVEKEFSIFYSKSNVDQQKLLLDVIMACNYLNLNSLLLACIAILVYDQLKLDTEDYEQKHKNTNESNYLIISHS
jgi:hypothetical protein